MTECDNATMRDALPDFISGTLSRTAAAVLEQHLASCTACTDEVALLRVACAVRPAAVSLDIGAIVAAISVAAPQPAIPDATVRALASAPSLRRSWWSWQPLKAAAAIGVLVVGGGTVLVARQGGLTAFGADRVTAPASADVAATGPASTPSAAVPNVTSTPNATTTPNASDTPSVAVVGSGSSRGGASQATAAAVSVGDLSEYTDAELERMLARLERWDGATSAEPSTQVPIVAVPKSGSER